MKYLIYLEVFQMNIKKNISDNLFYVFFTLCTVILAENSLLLISDHHFPATVGITSFISVFLTLFIFINRKKTAVYLGAGLLIILIILLFRITGISLFEFTRKSAVNLFTGRTLKISQRIYVTSIFSMLLAVMLFPLLRIRIARHITSALTAVLLVYYGILSITVSFIESFSAAGIIMSFLIEFCLYALYHKKLHQRLNNILSFMIPLVIVFSLTVAVIPSSEKPISWSLVKKIINGISSSFSSIISDIDISLHPEKSEFSIDMQGYSDPDNVFGNGISDNGQCQLDLSFTSHPYSSVYLTGSVSDTYTGQGWKNTYSSKSHENDFYLDYCETILAFNRAGLTKKDLSDFTNSMTVFIKYKDIQTKTLFYPLKAKTISGAEKYDASSPSLILDKRAKSEDEYRVNFLEIDYDSEQYRSVIPDKFSYNDDLIQTGDLIDSRIPKDINIILGKRAEKIKTAYTQLPECITQRTYKLADTITENYANNYEKLRAIEEYLRGFKYTKKPGPVPDGCDPVDYFLFESGTGFCTYFASSMAILARCEGIPTRYVQGFAVDCNMINSLNDYPVCGSQAHAWVEAYIEGVGWIPFEPTAAGSSIRYSFNGKKYSESDIKYQNHDYVYPHDELLQDTTDPSITEKTDDNLSVYFLIPFTIILAILLFTALYILIKIRLFIKKYHVETDTEKFISCYKMMLYLYGRNKLRRKDGETIACFSKRICVEGSDENSPFLSITSVFDRIRYREDKASAEELKLSEEHLRNMFGMIKYKHGKAASLIAFIVYCFKQ